MLVPLAIFLIALGASGFAAARWLPALAQDRVGELAFTAVCVLAAISMAIVALDVYETVRRINRISPGIADTSKADVLASSLLTMLTNAGPLLGLAAAVYLLAPAQDDPDALQ